MQIAERDTDSGNQHKSKKGIVTLVIASFNTTEFLEPIEKAFYHISVFVDLLIKRPRVLDVHFWRYRIFGRLLMQIFSDFFCAISFVRKNIAIFQTGKLFQQRNRFCTVLNVTGRQQKCRGSQVISNDGMNLCIQPAACPAYAARCFAPARFLIPRPACTDALIAVESILNSVPSQDAAQISKIFFNVPSSLHRQKQL